MNDPTMLPELSPHDELIFAYLDGELDAPQQAEFDRLCESDASFNNRLQSLQTMNEGLRLLSRVEQSAVSKPASRRRWIAYAALLAITTALFIYMNPKAPIQTFDAGALYTRISQDFEPQHICDTPEKFREYTQTAYGKPIEANFDTPLQLVGWRYMGGAVYNPDKPPRKPITRILMAMTADGTPVLAFFVPKGLPKPEIAPGSGFKLYTRSNRSVTVYEVSPLDSPQVLTILKTD